MQNEDHIHINGDGSYLDHFDTYTFFILGFFSIIFSIVMLIFYFKIKKIRKHPGDLIIGLIFSDLFLSIHWFAHSIYTKWIINKDIDFKGYFCKCSAVFAFFSGALELTYNTAFIISIILGFKFGIREGIIKKIYYHIFPIIISIISPIVMYGKLGKNYYGTCSIQPSSKRVTYISPFIILILVIIGSYSLFLIHKYLKSFKNQKSKIEKLQIYYRNYIILFWLSNIIVIGFYFSSYFYVNNIIYESHEITFETKKSYKLFLFNRMLNLIKISLPILNFYLRITEPYVLYKIKKYYSKQSNLKLLNFDDYETSIYSNFLVNRVKNYKNNEYIKNILIIISYYYPKEILFYSKRKDSDNNWEKLTFKMNKKSFESLIDQKIEFLDFNLKIYYIKKFSSIYNKNLLKIIENSFDLNKNYESMVKKFGDGGASGEYFFLTNDQKFIIKTISYKEFIILCGCIETYISYILENKNSFITKILGLIKINFTELNEQFILIIMENKFNIKIEKINRKYDLKGSKYNRKSLKSYNNLNITIEKTLKDLDFEKLENNKIEIEDKKVRQQIYEQFIKDFYFFYKFGIIDYSILLGICYKDQLNEEEIIDLNSNNNVFISKNKIYILGIIDYFQLYNNAKKLEKIYKKTVNLNFGLDTSSQNSLTYRERISRFVKDILNIEDN